MKRNKIFLAILYFLIFALGAVSLVGCNYLESLNKGNGSGNGTQTQEPVEPVEPAYEKIVIFSAKDNDTPLTGNTCTYSNKGGGINNPDNFSYTPVASVKVEEADKPALLKDYDLVKIEKVQAIYLNMKYTAQEIEEYKSQGYTYLSFKFMLEDEDLTKMYNKFLEDRKEDPDLSPISPWKGANFGLFSRHSNYKGTSWRIDRPIVYDVNIPIDQLIAEMTDTTDDTKEFATLNEREVLLTKAYWDIGLNFARFYFTDMVLVKESGLKTTPNFDPTNPKPIG